MIMDSIFNSRPDLKRKFETIDRNISHTASININQMKADEILGHHREQKNGSAANFKLRMPALSSESNSVDSFSHDINEVLLQQQQRIQSVIQNQSARRYQNLGTEHSNEPTIRVSNRQAVPLGGQSPRIQAFSPQKQPQQRNFHNPKRQRNQIYGSVDWSKVHSRNKKLDQMVGGMLQDKLKVGSWDGS